MLIRTRCILALFLVCVVQARFEPSEVDFIRKTAGDRVSDASVLGTIVEKLLGSDWRQPTQEMYLENIVPHVDHTFIVQPRISDILAKLGFKREEHLEASPYEVHLRIYPKEIKKSIEESHPDY